MLLNLFKILALDICDQKLLKIYGQIIHIKKGLSVAGMVSRHLRDCGVLLQPLLCNVTAAQSNVFTGSSSKGYTWSCCIAVAPRKPDAQTDTGLSMSSGWWLP